MHMDFHSWLQSERDYLLRFALARLNDRDKAEDAVQETFLAALKGETQFAGRSSQRTWLTGILKHKIADLLRRDYREPNVSTLMGDEDTTDNDIGESLPAGNWSDPLLHVERKQFLRRLHSSLEKLPDKQKHAFVLRDLHDRDSDEICRALGVTSGNLWILLFRARASLRKSLEEGGGFALGTGY